MSLPGAVDAHHVQRMLEQLQGYSMPVILISHSMEKSAHVSGDSMRIVVSCRRKGFSYFFAKCCCREVECMQLSLSVMVTGGYCHWCTGGQALYLCGHGLP